MIVWPGLEAILQTIAAGLLVGCTYGLMCVALGLIFGVMRLINFAQGDFLMLGMYFAMLIVASLGLADMFGALPAILIAAGLSVPVFFVFGWLLHAGLISLIEKSGHGMNESEIHQTQLIMTLGISLVAANGGLMLFGSTPVSINTALSSSAWKLAPFGGTDI